MNKYIRNSVIALLAVIFSVVTASVTSASNCGYIPNHVVLQRVASNEDGQGVFYQIDPEVVNLVDPVTGKKYGEMYGYGCFYYSENCPAGELDRNALCDVIEATGDCVTPEFPWSASKREIVINLDEPQEVEIGPTSHDFDSDGNWIETDGSIRISGIRIGNAGGLELRNIGAELKLTALNEFADEYAVSVTNLEDKYALIEGIKIEGFEKAGIKTADANVRIHNCKFHNNGFGANLFQGEGYLTANKFIENGTGLRMLNYKGNLSMNIFDGNVVGINELFRTYLQNNLLNNIFKNNQKNITFSLMETQNTAPPDSLLFLLTKYFYYEVDGKRRYGVNLSFKSSDEKLRWVKFYKASDNQGHDKSVELLAEATSNVNPDRLLRINLASPGPECKWDDDKTIMRCEWEEETMTGWPVNGEWPAAITSLIYNEGEVKGSTGFSSLQDLVQISPPEEATFTVPGTIVDRSASAASPTAITNTWFLRGQRLIKVILPESFVYIPREGGESGHEERMKVKIAGWSDLTADYKSSVAGVFPKTTSLFSREMLDERTIERSGLLDRRIMRTGDQNIIRSRVEIGMRTETADREDFRETRQEEEDASAGSKITSGETAERIEKRDEVALRRGVPVAIDLGEERKKEEEGEDAAQETTEEKAEAKEETMMPEQETDLELSAGSDLKEFEGRIDDRFDEGIGEEVKGTTAEEEIRESIKRTVPERVLSDDKVVVEKAEDAEKIDPESPGMKKEEPKLTPSRKPPEREKESEKTEKKTGAWNNIKKVQTKLKSESSASKSDDGGGLFGCSLIRK